MILLENEIKKENNNLITKKVNIGFNYRVPYDYENKKVNEFWNKEYAKEYGFSINFLYSIDLKLDEILITLFGIKINDIIYTVFVTKNYWQTLERIIVFNSINYHYYERNDWVDIIQEKIENDVYKEDNKINIKRVYIVPIDSRGNDYDFDHGILVFHNSNSDWMMEYR